MVLVLSAVCGCAGPNWVTLREVPHNPLASSLNLFAPEGPRPSERTMLLLRQYDLEQGLHHDPCKLLVDLREVINREPSADKLYSLSELAYLGGKKNEKLDSKLALELYGAAVMHAYLYLFDGSYSRSRNPYDPEFRGACDLYNGALEGALRIVKKQGGLAPGKTQTICSATQTMEFKVVVRGHGWRDEDFDHFEFASDYEVNGLKNQYHTYGLGVPLIAVRKNNPEAKAVERYYPKGLSFPVTAFLRVQPHHDGAQAHHEALLELFDPLSAADVLVAGRRVPLETDLSTPLAYFLNEPELRNLDVSTVGLLNPEKTQKAQGLYMLEPYQAGKIPVLMVHGIWSSPITWMEMFNDLRSAPEIRDRYQFWFYLYPTGQPFWYSAAQLREDLANMRATIDPEHREWALDQMVLVGHSMGGLVAKLQTVESGNDYWGIVSDKPLEMVKATPEIRRDLASTFFFHPNPAVKRLITIGTPHRGSNYAGETARYIGSKLITLPKQLVSEGEQLHRDNPGLFRESNLIDVPTSIDSLAPSCPILPLILSAQRSPGLKFHNIVGRIPDKGFFGNVPGGTDGVVPLSSAHLDGVDSEIIVSADHTNLHRHPRSVLEVRRILLEHLNEIRPPAHNELERLPWTVTHERVHPAPPIFNALAPGVRPAGAAAPAIP